MKLARVFLGAVAMAVGIAGMVFGGDRAGTLRPLRSDDSIKYERAALDDEYTLKIGEGAYHVRVGLGFEGTGTSNDSLIVITAAGPNAPQLPADESDRTLAELIKSGKRGLHQGDKFKRRPSRQSPPP